MEATTEGLTVRVERETIEMRTSTPQVEPDPDWSYTDEAGHEHRWVDGEVPTVEVVEIGTYLCLGCLAEHTIRETRCKECGQQIDRGYRDMDPQPPGHAPGPRVVSGSVELGSPHYDQIVQTFQSGSETTIRAEGVTITGVRCMGIQFGGPAEFVARELHAPNQGAST